MVRLLRTYRDRLRDLRRDPRFRYVLVLKNRGAVWSRYPPRALPRHRHPVHPEAHRGRARRARASTTATRSAARSAISSPRRCATPRAWSPSAATSSASPPSPRPTRTRPGSAPWRTRPTSARSPTSRWSRWPSSSSTPLARLGKTCDDPAYSIALHAGALDGSDRARVPLALGDRPAPRPRARHGMGHGNLLEPGGPRGRRATTARRAARVTRAQLCCDPSCSRSSWKVTSSTIW